MKKIVSNATPLIYLAKIGKINLLRRVFEEVVIPVEVKIEAVERGKKLGERDAYVLEKAINEGWLKVFEAKLIKIPIELENGEKAAISLARNLNLKEVLVDEVSARTAARLLDLKPRGTVFVLLKALELKEIDLDEFLTILEELIKEGFRLGEEVYIEAVRKARKIAERR